MSDRNIPTEPVRRWRCTSYCLCTPLSEQHGHFEQNRLGVWVLHTDVERMEREIENLRRDLEIQAVNAKTVIDLQRQVEYLKAQICGYVRASKGDRGDKAAFWWELQEIAAAQDDVGDKHE